jgi:hypothetical protein
MPVSTEAFNALIRPGLRKDFRDNYEKYGEEEWKGFLKAGTMDMPEVQATIFTGVSRLYEKSDLEAVVFSTPKLGPKVGGIDKEFGVGVAIGRKIYEDDQYGKMKEAGKWLANAARQTYEYRAAGFIDDAFAGSTYKGIDGVALISASHTFLNNGATLWSNLAPAVQLSMTGVTSLLDIFGTMKNHDGDPIKMMLDTLVIGNNAGDIHTAMQILNTQKEPFTADNNENVIKQRIGGTKLVISRYKSSAKSYFGIDSKWNDAHLLVRRPVKMDDDHDFKTDAALFKLTTRFMIWHVDPRGWAGANPS